MTTKKVGSAGRFGARYGQKAKRKVSVIESLQKKAHKCLYCSKAGGLRRLATGIWQCNKCNVKFAGGAYTPECKEN